MKPFYVTFVDGSLVYSSDYNPSADGIVYLSDSDPSFDD